MVRFFRRQTPRQFKIPFLSCKTDQSHVLFQEKKQHPFSKIYFEFVKMISAYICCTKIPVL